MERIRVGILGYGNLGQGVLLAVQHAPDMELVGVFSRRSIQSTSEDVNFYHVDDLLGMKEDIDVLMLCGSSDKDLPQQGPYYAQHFNTVDAFDTHHDIPDYFAKLDEAGRQTNHLSIIATGWDPGLFSLHRMLSEAILPEGETYTFWGPGKSQGHGAAVRQVEGVQDAVQYTIPNQDLLEAIQQGEKIDYTSTSAHVREVYAVLEEGADAKAVEEEIVNMPNYFEGYETTVHFISQEELDANHAGLPHGGRVMRLAETSPGQQSLYQFSLDLDSNPEFTASVSVAFARAAHRMYQEGMTGAYSIFDVPLGMLSTKNAADLRREFL